MFLLYFDCFVCVKFYYTGLQTAESRDKYHQLRVAAYCRVSTELEEQQNSYQVQIAYYTDLINKKKEWTLAGIFADEGISGTQTKKRTEFNRMIRMCRNKKIDLVITKSISRFARNTVDCLEYVRQLKDLGIGVIFEKENINTLTMTSEFMIALYGSFAQAESESISKNVSWGKEKAYREGKVQFQYKHLLGYKKGADGKPEIIPEEAETVKLIYTMFLDGHSMKNIALILHVKGIHTKTGSTEWRTNTITRILQNEKYVGDALLQKTFTSDCITHKVVKNHGERPMYLVTNHHDPIIDRDTYNRVQQELARRNSKRKISDKTVTEQGKYSSKYALSELLICGHCGTPYRRTTWAARGKKQIVWRCLSRLEHGKKYCPDSPTIKEEQLHRGILRAINNYYSCRNDIVRILKANIGSVLECQGQEEILSVEKRLKEIDQARTDLVNLIASGGCDEDKLDSEFAKLYAEEQGLSERLTMLKSQNKTSEETQAKLDKIMDMIEHEKFELETFDNVLIRKLIECVKILSKTEILVIFKGGYEVRTEIE
ncbi:recombinase family protein [Ruminococcus sp. AM31-15AC]|uniref:recombinase family protein n=1 Tax=Ruminococcus sp. AM31-15AC TaxID=2293202 RepID=UPI000E4B5531|nr:recombinase family protein [Ruminococcus sp. AM31-15AC]